MLKSTTLWGVEIVTVVTTFTTAVGVAFPAQLQLTLSRWSPSLGFILARNAANTAKKSALSHR
jgi:hypothetical protein